MSALASRMEVAIKDTLSYFGEDGSVTISDMCSRMHGVLTAFNEAQRSALAADAKQRKLNK